MNGTIDLAAVAVFVRVAELRSFRGAGDALGVPRSTVSRQVRSLEDSLGTRLLQRSTRHVELTSAGKAYLAKCRPALDTVLEASRTLTAGASSETAGRLRVTAPVTLGEELLGESIAECLALNPQMSIEVVLTDRHVDLVGEKFDLAFRTGTLKDTSLVMHELWRGQARCFASREYLRDRGTPKTPRDLGSHDAVIFGPLAPKGRWRFHLRSGRAIEIPLRARLVVSSIPLAIDAASRGVGIVRIPRSPQAAEGAQNRLVEILEDYASPPRIVYAVHASGGKVSAAARAFLEIAKRRLMH